MNSDSQPKVNSEEIGPLIPLLAPLENSNLGVSRAEAEAHTLTSKTLFELVYGWIKDSRRVRLCSGTNDDDGRSGYFAVIEDGSTELVSVWLEPEAIKRAFPKAKRFDPDTEVDDSVFNYALGGNVFAAARALEAAVSFLLTGQGEITFEEFSKDRLDWDWDPDDLEEDLELVESSTVVAVSYSLVDHQRMSSETWDAFVLLPQRGVGETSVA